MRTLRLGSVGDDVRQWEAFLRGKELFLQVSDGVFDEGLREAVEEFQRLSGLRSDGVVGPMTWAEALRQGMSAVLDDSEEEAGPNWPPKPSFPQLTAAQRQQVFTQFSFTPAPTPGNPEAIKMDQAWARANIAMVEIPQLRGVPGAPSGPPRFPFHRLAQHQVSGLFTAWGSLGLLGLVKSWGGSFAPRFVRGSRTALSNHSYGTAFDINVAWNGLGVTPALVGRDGSVRRLVPVANKLGIYWGGHFSRPDGMHFELATVMSKDDVESVLRAL